MNKKQKCIVAILALLLAFTVVFIFSNSLQSGEESRETSGKFASLLRGLIEKIFGENANVNYIVRKGAHLAEFTMLGFFAMLLIGQITKYTGKKLLFCGLFGTLAVAVADEYIQSFTGRTSLVSDVLIDFTGALIGMTVAFLLYFIMRKVKR